MMQVFRQKDQPQSKHDVISILSEQQIRLLFYTIASNSSSSDILITQLHMTRKRYYSRITHLKKAGLIKKRDGKYSLSCFGKVVYSAVAVCDREIINATENFYKLHIIDNILTNDNDMNKIETDKIISLLLDTKTKDILMSDDYFAT